MFQTYGLFTPNESDIAAIPTKHWQTIEHQRIISLSPGVEGPIMFEDDMTMVCVL